jgi:hypothetical protein
MELRKHPLMSYRGIPSWPPEWVWVLGKDKLCPQGEVGVLEEVRPSQFLGPSRLFLVIEYFGSTSC